MSGATTSGGKVRRRDKVLGLFKLSSSSPMTPDDAGHAHSPDLAPPRTSTSSLPKTSELPESPSQPVRPLSCSPVPSTLKPDPVPVRSQDILQNAWRKLHDHHREILKPYVSSTSNDDTAQAMEQALAAAKEKQQQYDEKRLKFTFAGRTVVLTEAADKVVEWVNRLKLIGDMAATIDPLHAGLPWAGICFVLNAVVSGAEQMAAFLVGCETSLYMINRLKAYMEFLEHVPSSKTRENLESRLTELYALILSFLAQAIEAYQRPTFRRTLDCLWQGSEVQDFEQNCDKLANRVEIEAKLCDRTLDGQDRMVLKQLQETLEDIKQNHQFQVSFKHLEAKIDLGNLKSVASAPFDAYGQVHRECHRGTREGVLRDIQDWAGDPQGPSMFWLQGMAGTGKSTISYTIADWLSKQPSSAMVGLGASFFFKRGEGDRGSAVLLFPTIVRQLVAKVPGLGELVAEAVRKAPDICTKNLGQQFQTLIREPLEALPAAASSKTYIVVIDALDECAIDKTDVTNNSDTIDAIPQLWSQLADLTTISLRLFMTSRPDLRIRPRFNKMNNAPITKCRDLMLHEVPLSQVRHDIFTFLTDKFTTFRQNYDDDHPGDEALGNSWINEDVLQELTNIAVPLFIVAATIYRFVDDASQDPLDRLGLLLHSHRKVGEMSPIAKIYRPVLQQLHDPESNREDQEDAYIKFRTVVGSIITLVEPLSRAALADLLQVARKTLSRCLLPFHSVLQIPPSGSDAPIRPLHLSFGEFLTGTSKEIEGQPFRIDRPVTHGMLMTKCLELLCQTSSYGLCENMCDLSYPGQSRQDIALDKIQRRFPPSVQYACRYWTYHAQESKRQIVDHDAVHEFLQKHFLHWLEALSLLDCLADVISHIEALRSLVTHHNSVDVAAFLDDARRFVFSYRYVVNIAPLQLYSSTIIFAPQASIVRNICGRVPSWVTRSPITPQTWGPELQQLEGHSNLVLSVLFSPDGTHLASASTDGTSRLWDARTGQETQKLENWKVSDLVFSLDGSQLASVSSDNMIRFWHVRTGQEAQKLQGHTSDITRLELSPDGCYLASAHFDGTVWLWQIRTGQVAYKLEGHTKKVNDIAFSPDGSLLASTSEDCTLRLWHATTGRQIHELDEHSRFAYHVTFSSNGSLLAWTNWEDKTRVTRLWNVKSKQEVQKLGGDTRVVNFGVGDGDIAFSPDGSQLASAFEDGTVRLWCVATGQEVQMLKGHSDEVCAISFSPDGGQLVSASNDRTLRVWDTRTGQQIQQLNGHTDWVLAAVFSPNGSQVASASCDHTIRLWDLRTGGEVHKQENRASHTTSVVFSPNGKLVASVSEDNVVRLWATEAEREAHRLEGHGTKITAVAFSPDSRLLASGFQDGTILLWDVTGQEVKKSERCFDFEGETDLECETSSERDTDPGGDIDPEDDADSKGDIESEADTDAEGDTESQDNIDREGWITTVMFSPDSKILASESLDGRIRLWDTTGQVLRKIEGRFGTGYILAFSPDGSLLASGSTLLASRSSNNAVRLWDMTGQKVHKLKGHTHLVRAAAFRPMVVR